MPKAEIIVIAAMTHQGVIGKNNSMPWHLPADLQRFKQVTMGHPMVMGRKTFESLPGVLPGRRHVVLSRNRKYPAKGCDVVTGWAEAEALLAGADKIFVIGGAEVHALVLPFAQQLCLTFVHADLEGDTYFPSWDEDDWQEVHREFRHKDEKNCYDLEYVQYRRMGASTSD